MQRIQKIGVTAFIYDNKKVLTVKRSAKESFLPGYHELPGGKIEFGESPENALKREIKEETSLNIKIIRPYSIFSYTSNDNHKHTIDIQFIVEAIGDINKIKLSNEHESFNWIKQNEINNFQFSEQMEEVILKGFDEINNKI